MRNVFKPPPLRSCCGHKLKSGDEILQAVGLLEPTEGLKGINAVGVRTGFLICSPTLYITPGPGSPSFLPVPRVVSSTATPVPHVLSLRLLHSSWKRCVSPHLTAHVLVDRLRESARQRRD